MGGKLNTAISGAAGGAAAGSSFGPWGAAIGGLAGGALGFLGGSDDNSSKMYEEMLKEARGIPLPVLKESNPELYKAIVQLNPQLEQIVEQGPSAMQGISLDPAQRQAQVNALRKFQDISAAGGRDAEFQAEAAKLQNDINANLQGNVGAIQQNLAARGMSGGMSEMVQKQIAAQQGANRQAQMGLDLNAQAQQRALAALSSGAQLGGQMNQQQFQQQADIAAAKDRIAAANAMNRQRVMGANIDRGNIAQASNAQNLQNIANQNVGVRNVAAETNRLMPQQQFENQMAKYGQVSRAGAGAAGAQSAAAQQQNQFLGNALTSAASAYGASRKKKNEDEY